MIKTFATIAAIAAPIGTTMPASAADMAVKSPLTPTAVSYSWTGCYVGGNFGFGWAHKTIIDEEPSLPGGLRNDHVNSGVVGGGQLGCDYQFSGNWAVGIQGLINVADVKGSSSDPQNAASTWQSKNSWFATLTGRVGYAIQPMALLYVKGGGAWVRDSNLLLNPVSLNPHLIIPCPDGPPVEVSNTNSRRTGPHSSNMTTLDLPHSIASHSPEVRMVWFSPMTCTTTFRSFSRA